MVKKIYKRLILIACNLWMKFAKKQAFDSTLLRKIYASAYGVQIGQYSYGCFDPKRIPSGTKIGRYCSFSSTCYRFPRNHGISFISLHPFLYNAKLGVVKQDSIKRVDCLIEDDVWVGHNVSILPSVNIIGRGAILAAGSVVTKNVPKYAIVAGNPARVIKFRFSQDVISEIENTDWWLLSKSDLKTAIDNFPHEIYSPSEGLREISSMLRK